MLVAIDHETVQYLFIPVVAGPQRLIHQLLRHTASLVASLREGSWGPLSKAPMLPGQSDAECRWRLVRNIRQPPVYAWRLCQSLFCTSRWPSKRTADRYDEVRQLGRR